MSELQFSNRTIEIARQHQLLLKARQFDSIVNLVQWLNKLSHQDRDFLRGIIKQEDVAEY